ncbi:MAG: hypothetical protein ACOC4M_01650 [Promethearchaeia archaeon]
MGRFPKITRPSGISIAIASTNKTTPNATSNAFFRTEPLEFIASPQKNRWKS